MSPDIFDDSADIYLLGFSKKKRQCKSNQTFTLYKVTFSISSVDEANGFLSAYTMNDKTLKL